MTNKRKRRKKYSIDFFDREKEIDRVEKLIDANTSVLITGPRGVGKSMLLHILQERQLSKGLFSRIIDITDYEKDALILEIKENCGNNKKVIYLLDNFENATSILCEKLRAVINALPNLVLIITGKASLNKYFAGYDAPFYRLFETVFLDNWQLKTTSRLLEEYIDKVDTELVEVFQSMTKGHPVLVKIILENCSEITLKHIVDISKDSSVFREFNESILTDISEQQKRIYLTLAKKGPMRTSEISKVIGKNAAITSKQLSRLKASFFVEKNRGRYEVKVPILGSIDGDFVVKALPVRIDKLQYLTELSRQKLCKDVLIPLFKDMKFKNIRFKHDKLKYGEDIIYAKENEFLQTVYTGVKVVKEKIDIKSVDPVANIIQDALNEGFVESSSGDKNRLNDLILINLGGIEAKAQTKMGNILKKVGIERLVNFIDGQYLIDLIDRYSPTIFWHEYEYFNRYFEALQRDFNTIKDISAIGQKEPIPLEKIYVSLKLKEEVKEKDYEVIMEEGEKISGRVIGADESEPRIKKERIPEKEKILEADDVLKEWNKAIIVGAPGSGKTTLLRYFALKTAKESMDKLERECVPIYMTLREVENSKKTVREYIEDVFEKYEFPRAKDFVEKDLQAGKCLLLLDGFDELASLKRQREVTKLIHDFLRDYPKARVVVTSRIAGYHGELNFTKVEIREFNDEQIKEFINNWFKDTEYEWKAEPLYKRVMENDAIKRIARNPLMIAIIAIIFEEDKRLPEQRVELYKRCVEVLLSRWDAQKRFLNQFDSTAKEQILRRVALYFHLGRQRQFKKDKLLPLIEDELPRLNLDKGKSEEILSEIVKRSFLLKEIGIGIYDFLHLSFQEYFTAVELRERRDYDTILDNNHLYDPWWEEPILLSAGIDRNATELIKEIKKRERKDKNFREDLFHSNIMMMGKCIVDADYTEGKLKKEIVDRLFDVWKNSAFEPLRDNAQNVLVRIKSDYVIKRFTKTLNDKSSDFRKSAIEALGNIGSEKAVDALLDVLNKDKNLDVRESAARALGNIGSEKAIDPLLNALRKEKNYDIRWGAAIALGEIGSEKAVDALLNALNKDEDSDVRRGAAIALEEIGSEKAVDALLDALNKDKNLDVRESAARALGNIDSEKAIDPLLNALRKEKNYEVRSQIAIALGGIDSEKAVDALLNALSEDENSDVRWGAAIALRGIDSEKAVDALLNALSKDENSDVRWGAAIALGEIGSEKGIDPLLHAFKKEKASIVRGVIAIQLGRVDSEKAIDALLDALNKDKNPSVRESVARTLGRIGSEKAVETLLGTLKKDKRSHVRKSAAEALGDIGSEKAVDALLDALNKDKDLAVRISAVEALGDIGSEKAIDQLKTALNDEGKADSWERYGKVMDFAFEALYKICLEKNINIYPEDL